MDAAFIESILSIAIRAATSVLFATLGGILTERAGVLNLGIEGTMLLAAMSGFAGAFYSQSAWIGVFAAVLVGGLLAVLHGFWCISLSGNQVASGLAFVILGTGLADFLGQRLGPDGVPLVGLVSDKFERLPLPLLSTLPIVGGSFFNQDVLSYLLYVVVPLLWLFLFRTQPGIHLRAVGENPQAADALGVNVFALRYRYTILGGMLIGLGGAHLSLAYTPGWSSDISGGRGWIAIAMIIFSLWNPLRAVIGGLLFGGVTAIQFRLQAVGSSIPTYFLNMLPYAVTIIALVLVNRRRSLYGRSEIPTALGVPYHRES
jgi:simple sugar transport system permease protein